MNWRDIDTLCSRIAVLTNGEVSALGSSRHVRALLADGHTAHLKLKLKPIRTYGSSVSNSDVVSDDDERAKNAEAKKERRKKRRMEILAAKEHFNDPDDDVDSKDSDDKKKNSNEPRQSSDLPDDTFKRDSQQERDELRHYLTSRQGSDHTLADEDDDNEEAKKVYRKSRHNFIRIQPDNDDDDDSPQSNTPNSDRPQSTGEEIVVTLPPSSPTESVDERSNQDESTQPGSTQSDTARRTDQAKTSPPKSVQLENADSKTDQSATSRSVNSESTQGGQDEQTLDRYESDLMLDEEFARKIMMRDERNVRFLRDNDLRGTVYADLARETMKRNVISLSSVQALKTDFKTEFPTSKLADEHLSMLHFHIKGDKTMTYSAMFSKLEKLKTKYEDIVEDYTLSEISIGDVYSLLAKEDTA